MRIGIRLDAFSAVGWYDQSAPSLIRGKNTMVASEVDPRFGHEGRQSRNEIHRLECDLRGAFAVRRLPKDLVCECRCGTSQPGLFATLNNNLTKGD